MKNIEKSVAKNLEKLVANKLIRKYGLAILILLIPVFFWVGGIFGKTVGLTEKSASEIASECIAMEKIALSIVFLVYIAIRTLSWHDRRR